MAHPTQGASAPARTTSLHSFFSCNPRQDPLFAVRAGVSANDALEMASSLLASAATTAYRVAGDEGCEEIFAVAYLVEMARGVVDAALMADAREVRHD